MAKVVLAYSGGLDTSIIIPWLKENYGYDVIAMVADLGQGDDYDAVREKALKSGAAGVHVRDVKREFVEDYLFPLVRSGAVYEGKYLLGTSVARPLIAKCLVETAEAEGAEAVAHGATGKGNDQVRFEVSVMALNPDLKVVAPWREWDIRSRQEAMAYAAARGIPVPATKERPFSMDQNLWHLSHEGGVLEDPGNAPPEDLYLLTVPPERAPDRPTYVELEFERGVPKRLDGAAVDPVTLVERLNALGGANGVGIVDMVENRLVGMKSRGVYETPGGTILVAAHRELELLTLDRNTLHFKDTIAVRYAELVYDGLWFTPLREALDAFVTETQKPVTGRVRLKLYKGNCVPAGAWSPCSLYDQELSTFEEDEVYDQKDAAGFINLFGLPVRIQARVRRRNR
ncbi:argininosuccinate synthase [Candidatus Desulforudis audaxviator]|uniref:Argininosuccinate synthase n=1 Tax=Desulforudis audaxviator (strain MP104C) TaxID=477974 RepID=B1I1D0_DESAP|nr:argininosuccinate synthase [Candidatus Desulforudis audaxviator]ACA58902.1 Argininosuccinate synthase [Candidatus Desulforudis audaxviator MP104C]AZK58921.1 Argininosuccinate synthase [Candidatus Desulforudis audaxviator]